MSILKLKVPVRICSRWRVLLVFLFALNGGCATIIHGNKQAITVQSRPDGARVFYKGADCGSTPCTVQVSRRPLTSLLVLRKDGYRDTELLLKNGVSLWALLGNLVVGGIPGYIIDAATGSFGNYYTDSYTIDLNQ